MYREWSSRLRGVEVWERTVPEGGAPLRVLPDGCTDLIWSGGELIVAGPDTTAALSAPPPGARFVGLRFPPGLGPLIFGVPASELRDQGPPLVAIWPPAAVRRLTDRLDAGADIAATLEAVAEERLRSGERRLPASDLSTAVARRLRVGQPVARVASALGLGERRLHRHCLAAFGYGPKTVARVLRMNDALTLARQGVPFAVVAADAGYADQAHLAREVRALAGVPLRILVNRPAQSVS